MGRSRAIKRGGGRGGNRDVVGCGTSGGTPNAPPPPTEDTIRQLSLGQQKRDPIWQYCRLAERAKNYQCVHCKFCDKLIIADISRLKEHLEKTHKNVVPCIEVPDDVNAFICGLLKKSEMTKVDAQKNWDDMVSFGTKDRTSSPTPTILTSSRGIRGPMYRFVTNTNDDLKVIRKVYKPSANQKRHEHLVWKAIGRYIIENAIPFNTIRSPSFTNMVKCIENYGRGLRIPSMHEISNKILDEEVEDTKAIVNDVKKTWMNTGVSILSNGWKDFRGRSILNFLVNCPEGIIFLKSIDASNAVKDAKLMFKLLDDVVEAVGKKHVIQIVTDNASNYKAAGALLMQKRKTCIGLLVQHIILI